MKNAVTVLKMTAARWPSSAICGGLPFPQAGPFSYSGNHLESGGIRVNLLFWCDGRKRIHAIKSAIHAIDVRQYVVFYDIKSESRRRWIL